MKSPSCTVYVGLAQARPNNHSLTATTTLFLQLEMLATALTPYTVASRKYAPSFCNLSLTTKRRGGLHAGCNIFSRA